MYEVDPFFWLKLFLLILAFLFLLRFFNAGLRKWLKVEKRKTFSYNHVNKKHKRIDWTIRIAFLLLILIGFSINVTRYGSERFWYWETYFVIFLFVITSEVTRAIMEKKYSANKNDYLYTLFQLAFMSVFVLSFLGYILIWNA
ncbi:DUF4181 domain-containing protein [Pseudalkalibacillus sp. SCS-8]|uniref:DUF4181 domain-containing protein n=1 Tax=Pseudalkalibacillus nanhaiensis TaxID=3115291 RepID=UPI0032DB16AE